MDRTIYIHISQLITPLGHKEKHGAEMNDIHKICDAAIVVEGNLIKEVGTTQEVLAHYKPQEKDVLRDLSGCTVLPGFVDSHTHFLFGGYRPEEFMMRLDGASYLEIHKMGGGIQNTVEKTRAMTKDEMIEIGRSRLLDMISMGVTTVEGKSGYGLDHDCEMRQLEAMKELDKELPISIVRTYLGAHSIPVEYSEDPDAYIQYMIDSMLPVIKEEELAEFVDIFCEEGVFSVEQSRRLLQAAKEKGFLTKIHADEIVSTGSAQLAAEVGATSADHLLMISEEGIHQIADSNTIATLLPCTAFCLNKPFAPARKMIDQGCAVALASDYNPGSCFTNSIPLMFALACIHMKMTLNEAICALTINGAAAIGRADQIGTIEAGKLADLVVLNVPQYEFLVYHTCKNLVGEVIKDGIIIYSEK